MPVQDLDGRFGADGRSHAFRALVASSAWLRAGFVALSVEVIALIMLATGEAAPAIVIAVAVAAGVIARWSWHRARAALDVEAMETSSDSYSTTPVEPGAGEASGRVAV